MRQFTTLTAGDTLVRRGEEGFDLHLVLDGAVPVERDGEQLTPGWRGWPRAWPAARFRRRWRRTAR